jgi:hypothetical protein
MLVDLIPSPYQISHKAKKAGNHVLLFFATLVRTYAKSLIFKGIVTNIGPLSH